MTDAQFPIEVIQGVNYLQPFYYFDEENNPINLTGCTAKMQARPTVNADDPTLFSWSTEDGQISIDGAAGLVLVAVTAAQTAALDQYADAVYDLLLTFPDGFVAQLVSGPVSIVGRVTK